MSYQKTFGMVMPTQAELTVPDGNNNNGLAALAGCSDRMVTRHLMVHITGNRAQWEFSGAFGTSPPWRISPEQAEAIFSYKDGAAPETDGWTDDRISRALLRRVTLLESKTNIDEPVGIIIDGLPTKEFTGQGDPATCYLLGAGHVTTPQEVYAISGNMELGLMWMQRFPQFTGDNLTEFGVLRLQGANFFFVHESHPTIIMLKASQTELGVLMLPDTQIMEGQWYRVDLDTFTICVKTLRDGVLQHMPSPFDLSSLTIRLSNPDKKSWLNVPPQIVDEMLPESIREGKDLDAMQEERNRVADRYTNRLLYVTMRLAFEYALPSPNQQIPLDGGAAACCIPQMQMLAVSGGVPQPVMVAAAR